MKVKKSANFLASVVIAGFSANFATNAAGDVGQYSGADTTLVDESSLDSKDGVLDHVKYGGPGFCKEGILNQGDETYVDSVKISETNKEDPSGEVLGSETSAPKKEDTTNISTDLADTPSLSGKLDGVDDTYIYGHPEYGGPGFYEEGIPDETYVDSVKISETNKEDPSGEVLDSETSAPKKEDTTNILTGLGKTRKRGSSKKKRRSSKKKESKKHVLPSKLSSESGDEISEENARVKVPSNGEVKGEDTSAILSAAVNDSDLDGSKISVPSPTEIGDFSTENEEESLEKSEPMGEFLNKSVIGVVIALFVTGGILYLNSLLKRKAYSEEEEKLADTYSEKNEGTDVVSTSNENISTESVSDKQMDDQKQSENDENLGSGEKGLAEDECVDEEDSFGLYVLLLVELAAVAGLFLAVYKLVKSFSSSSLSTVVEDKGNMGAVN